MGKARWWISRRWRGRGRHFSDDSAEAERTDRAVGTGKRFGELGLFLLDVVEEVVRRRKDESTDITVDLDALRAARKALIW